MQPQSFVPVPLPSSPQREVLRGGFPRCAPHSALVFPPTRAEVIFGVLWELHRLHRKLPHSFVEAISVFTEPRERWAARKEEPEQ